MPREINLIEEWEIEGLLIYDIISTYTPVFPLSLLFKKEVSLFRYVPSSKVLYKGSTIGKKYEVKRAMIYNKITKAIQSYEETKWKHSKHKSE